MSENAPISNDCSENFSKLKSSIYRA